jgi:hypothetical protein
LVSTSFYFNLQLRNINLRVITLLYEVQRFLFERSSFALLGYNNRMNIIAGTFQKVRAYIVEKDYFFERSESV